MKALTPHFARMTSFFVMLSILLALVATSTVPAAHAQGATVPVSGFLFPIDDLTGEEMSAGKAFLARRPVTNLIFPNPGANGFLGTIVVQEQVVRVDSQGKGKHFTMNARGTFTGDVILDGMAYSCSFDLVLTAKGTLNNDLPIDHPDQGATSLTGTWTITGTNTCDLPNLRGSGTIAWPGGFVPVSLSGNVVT